ncbi:hypothetical protein [Actinoplanes sp. NPDC026670]|uniref:hypothetical protein n=1 Tax=Actinoplanes sp. NPDC026670 TaxID=3154700 RepID=UPI0033F3B5D5
MSTEAREIVDWISADGLVRFLPVPEDSTGGIWCAPGFRPADVELARKAAEAAGYSAADEDGAEVGWDDPSVFEFACCPPDIDYDEQLAAGRDETEFLEWCTVLVPIDR